MNQHLERAERVMHKNQHFFLLNVYGSTMNNCSLKIKDPFYNFIFQILYIIMSNV